MSLKYNRKIRVIELINGIVDAGAETIVKDLVVNLDRNQFDVFLLTEQSCTTNSANVRALLNNGIRIYSYFPTVKNIFYRIIRRILYAKTPSSKLPLLRKKYIQNKILELRPDVIHIHMHMLEYVYPIAELIPNTRILYSNYTLPSRYFNDKELNDYYSIAKLLVIDNGMRFTAMHDDMKEEVNRLFNVNDTVILRNGIDLSSFKQNVDKSKIRESLGIPSNAFVIGHVGRFIYIKNQSFLVDVFVEVLKQRDDAFLLMVGKGTDRINIENKLKDNNIGDKYKILSSVDDMSVIYKAMDVFVFPSLFEGIPNACIEAQAAGLRCVISSTITKDVFFSEDAIEADLQDSPKIWAKKVLDKNIKGIYHNDISNYDMKTVISQVEALYRNN